MTVAALSPLISYLEDGTTLAFAIPFKFGKNTIHAARSLADGSPPIELLPDIDYTVTGGATEHSGTLTLLASIAGATLDIARGTPITQELDFDTGDIFPAESHEAALDKLTMIEQERDEAFSDLASRALLVPPGETVADLPPADERAQGILGFDADGNPMILPSEELGSVAVVAQRVEYIATAGQTTFQTSAEYLPGYLGVYVNGVRLSEQEFTASDGINAVLNEPCLAGDVVLLEGFLGSETMTDAAAMTFIQAGAGAVQRSAQDKMRERVSLADFGAVGDGVADDWPALSKAVAAAAGRTLVFQGGKKYRINTDNGSIALANIRFEGEGHHEYAAPYNDSTAVLLIEGTTNAPFTLNRGFTSEGLTYFWPGQIETGSAPIAYPPLFQGTYITQFTFVRNTVVNAYDFLKLPGNGKMGDCLVTGNRIFALSKCFNFLGGVPESIFISDNLVSPGVYEDVVNAGPTFGLRDYCSANGIFINIDCGAATLWQSVDGLNLHNNTFFGMRNVVKLASGRLDVSVIAGNEFDACPQPFRCEGAAYFGNVHFIGNVWYSYKTGDTTTTDSAFSIASSGNIGRVHFTGNDFAFCRGSFIDVSGGSAVDVINIVGNTFGSWGQCSAGAADFYAIAINDNNCWGVVSGNTFTGAVAAANRPAGVYIVNTAYVGILGNLFFTCYVPVKIDAASGALVANNLAAGTIFAASFVNGAGPANVQERGNRWDKAPTKYAYPFFAATISAAQTFTGAKTKANFGSSLADENSNYNAGTSTFIAPVSGLYEFDVNLTNAAGLTVGDYWSITIEAAGSAAQSRGNGQYATANQVFACVLAAKAQYKLVAGDVVNVFVTRNSGTGNWVQLSDATMNSFQGRLVN